MLIWSIQHIILYIMSLHHGIVGSTKKNIFNEKKNLAVKNIKKKL